MGNSMKDKEQILEEINKSRRTLFEHSNVIFCYNLLGTLHKELKDKSGAELEEKIRKWKMNLISLTHIIRDGLEYDVIEEVLKTLEEDPLKSPDLSIINDDQIFYVKSFSGHEHLAKINLIENKYDKCYHYDLSNSLIYESGQLIDEEEIKEIRLATESEKLLMYVKFPELKPVQKDDLGFFWNDGFKADYVVGKLSKVAEGNYYKYVVGNRGFSGFYPFDPYKDFKEQEKEFLKES